MASFNIRAESDSESDSESLQTSEPKRAEPPFFYIGHKLTLEACGGKIAV